jgi:hypothetical protein
LALLRRMRMPVGSIISSSGAAVLGSGFCISIG